MAYFEHLRVTPWKPQFIWLPTIEKAADQINRPHEDWPKRVKWTRNILQELTVDTSSGPSPMFPGEELFRNGVLRAIHGNIFRDESFAGQWRKVNVTVGPHKPPIWPIVESLMSEFDGLYHHPTTINQLEAWYKDFNTIHPFQDGNGRVSGVVIAVASHRLFPDLGWYCPLQ